MARELKTGWQRIATSGPVVYGKADGRTIEKKWLEDMAKNYNTRLHTASLWPDHQRWFSPVGKIVALKIEDAVEPELKGEIQLFAILAPTNELIYANSQGRYTFPSIEVGENFRGEEGEFFLQGCGVVDEPASVGVSELKFSKLGSNDNPALCFTGEKIDATEAKESSESDDSIFTKASRFFKPKDKSNLNDEEDEDTMNKEQLEAFEAKQKEQSDALLASFSKLNDSFTKLSEKVGASDSGGEDESDGDSESDNEDSSRFSKLEKQLETLQDENKKLVEGNAKFAKVIDKLEKEESPGTNTDGDNPGGESEAECF